MTTSSTRSKTNLNDFVSGPNPNGRGRTALYDSSMMMARAIRLCRPPVLSVQDGMFVPAATGHETDDRSLDEIERRWDALRARNSRYFDGRLCHVLGMHRNGHGGCVLHIIECAYRFFAVQDANFDLGVRPLGVKGVVERNGMFLMGRRAPDVAMYQNLWEFAPSGSVEFGADPAAVIATELREETGIRPEGIPNAIALLFDPVLRCWEIVYRLAIPADAEPATTSEYPEVQWFPAADLPRSLSPVAQQIANFPGVTRSRC